MNKDISSNEWEHYLSEPLDNSSITLGGNKEYYYRPYFTINSIDISSNIYSFTTWHWPKVKMIDVSMKILIKDLK